MAFSKPQINTISTDIRDLSIYLRSTKKFGKSTLFRDLIIEKYGDPSKGLLVAVGAEIGYKLLDNLNVVHIETYQDFIELKKWLISQKGKEHNIEIVAFDVVEEIIPAFEKEVIRLSVIETKKPCKSIKSAFGGYNAGVEKTVEMIKVYFKELRQHFGVIAIGHTKFRTIKEKGSIDEEGYMQLTSNLQSNYEAVFGDVFDVTFTGYIDREIEEETVGEGESAKVKRRATGEVRKLFLRGNTLIDAGGRFAFGAVPEYIVFDKPNMAKEFIEIVEKGMALSKTGALNNKDVKLFEPKQSEEIATEELEDEILTEEESKDTEINIEHNKQLKSKVVGKYKTASNDQKKQVKKILAKYGATKLDETKPTQMFEDILASL